MTVDGRLLKVNRGVRSPFSPPSGGSLCLADNSCHLGYDSQTKPSVTICLQYVSLRPGTENKTSWRVL